MKKLWFACFFQLLLISGVVGQGKNKTAIDEAQIDLAGTWLFRMDSLKVGEQEKWYSKPAPF